MELRNPGPEPSEDAGTAISQTSVIAQITPSLLSGRCQYPLDPAYIGRPIDRRKPVDHGALLVRPKP